MKRVPINARIAAVAWREILSSAIDAWRDAPSVGDIRLFDGSASFRAYDGCRSTIDRPLCLGASISSREAEKNEGASACESERACVMAQA